MTETLTYLIRFKVDATDTAKLQQVSNAIKGITGTTPRIAQQNVAGLGNSLWKLASRAALTIPIWLALRGAIMGVIGAFSDGIKSIVQLDEALINAKNEIQDIANLDTFMVGLREQAIKLSRETGTSVEKVVESFRRFATAGIEATTALAGMNTAVKGARATMGDAVETSRFLADVYNQLGDRITEVSGTQAKFDYIMGTVSALMPKNTFVIKEFTDAFAKFGGTAKAAGLSLDETFLLIATSATAMQRGARAGTQLASAFNQLSKNSEEIRLFLGKDSLAGLSQFEIFSSVLERAGDAMAQPGGEGTVLRIIQDLFGNRGGRDVKALTANITQFRSEMERLASLSAEDREALLLQRYGTAMEKIQFQLDRVKQSLNELVREFVTGLTGTDDYANALKRINDELEKMIENARAAGNVVREAIGGGIKLGAAGAAIGIGLPLAAKAAGPFTALGLGGGLTYIGLVLKEGLTKLGAALIPRVAGSGAVAAAGGGITAMGLAGVGAIALGVNEIFVQYLRHMTNKTNQKIFEFMEQDTANIFRSRGKKYTPGGSEAPPAVEETDVYTLQQKLGITEELTKHGFNSLEIARLKYDISMQDDSLLSKQGARMGVILEYMKALNKESREFSENLQKTFQEGLSDTLMGEGTFADLAKGMGDALRQGFSDALAGNISDQLFKSTGLGAIFGDAFSNIRHANDKLGGPIKSAFDYGGKEAYDWIVAGFKDGMKGDTAASLTSAEGIKTALKGGGLFGTDLTLPGFGEDGIFSKKIGTGTIDPKTGAVLKGPATWGEGIGAVGGGLLSGYSSYQAAGGAGGSLSTAAGITGALGGAALGLHTLGFMGAGTASAAGLGAMLGPVGIALMVGAMIFSALSKTKSSSSSEQQSTKQVSSKIDVTNNKLDLVNRNLIALRGTMETYMLPDSAYFTEKRLLLEDQFSIDARRG